jgi:hypothetical protein
MTPASINAEDPTALPKAGAKPQQTTDSNTFVSAIIFFSAFSAQKSHVKP